MLKLNKVLWRKAAQASAAILAFLLVMAVTIALAAEVGSYIEANKGGTIIIDDDTCLIIPRKALEHDTLITAKVTYGGGKVKFKFKPEGLVFRKCVYVQKSMAAMQDALGYTLYYAPDEDNPDNYTETIKPKMKKENVTWALKHFSLYYHRRR